MSNWEEVLGFQVQFKVLEDTSRGSRYAARMLEFGLTAYGETGEEAFIKLTYMLDEWVKAHSELGDLDMTLKRVSIGSDPEFMAGVKRGLQARREGKMHPWRKVKAELEF